MNEQQLTYLNLDMVLRIHDEQVDLYGGSKGLRELTLLESAIFRPQSTFGGQDLYETLFEKAAALMHSLVLNHAFVDGNKRTGIVASLTFLELNGFKVMAEDDELYKLSLKLEAKEFNVEKLAKWFGRNTRRI